MTKSIADLQAGRRATREWKRAAALIIAFAVLGFLAAAIFAPKAHAQTSITLQPGKSVTVKAAPAPPAVHDTVIKVVTKCFTAQLVPITCPTTPPPVVTPPIDTTPTPPIVIPPPSTGAPQPGPTATILWRENFDAMTSANVSWISQGGSSLVAGMNGGKALQFSYTPGNSDNLIERTFASATDFYASYNFKISAGWLPYGGRTGSGMKWFMPWRDGSGVTPRYTCGVGQLTNPWWQFTCHDNGSTQEPNPFGQNKASAPNFGTTNDGNWHQYVLHVVTGNGGYEQIWIDGVLVLDNSANKYDHLAQGISLVQFPGLVVDGIPDAAHSGTITLDNVVFWKP